MDVAAQAAPFSNGSFEIASGGETLPVGSTAITNWVVVGAPGGSIDWYGGWLASDGSRSLDLDGGSPGGISQTFDTIIGREYIVLFDMAGNAGAGAAIKEMRVTAANASQDYQFDTTGKNYYNMGWQEMAFTFTANAATTTLTFLSLSPSGPYGPALDNVRVALVPLPVLSCVGFEPPMDQPVSVKRNRALPLKAGLLDDQGRQITDLDLSAQSRPVLQVIYTPGTGTAVDVTNEVLPAGQSSEGNQFQFVEGIWQFNLLTKNYTAQGIYTITMVPGPDNSYLIQPACTAGFIVR